MQVNDVPDYADYADYDARSRAEVIALISRQAKRIAEQETEIEHAERIRLQLWDKLDAARGEVAALRAELNKVKGHRAELAERCYRKDLELDELRSRAWTDD